MKTLESKTLGDSAVAAVHEVVIQVTPDEADDLRHALAVVDRYKQAALQALRIRAIDDRGEWHNFEFGVNGKTNVVHVVLKYGSIG